MLEGQTFIEFKVCFVQCDCFEGCHETADKTAGCSFEK